MSDERSFSEFYSHASTSLVRDLYFLTGDMTRAQDCVQDAFARAWMQWDKLERDGRDPVGWVRRVAWRLAIGDWRRAGAHLRALARHGPLEEVILPPSADVIALRQALAALPLKQRAVVVLFYFEDMPVKEIADFLNVNESAVKVRLHRARGALAVELSENPRGSKAWTPTTKS